MHVLLTLTSTPLRVIMTKSVTTKLCQLDRHFTLNLGQKLNGSVRLLKKLPVKFHRCRGIMKNRSLYQPKRESCLSARN